MKEIITLEEVCNAIPHFAAHMPYITKDDIKTVKLNPNLSWFDKFYIIRKMKKQLKYQKFMDTFEIEDDVYIDDYEDDFDDFTRYDPSPKPDYKKRYDSKMRYWREKYGLRN